MRKHNPVNASIQWRESVRLTPRIQMGCVDVLRQTSTIEEDNTSGHETNNATVPIGCALATTQVWLDEGVGLDLPPGRYFP